MLKRVAAVAAVLLLVLIAALAINTMRHGSRQLDVPPAPALAVDEAAAAERLAVAKVPWTLSACPRTLLLQLLVLLPFG